MGLIRKVWWHSDFRSVDVSETQLVSNAVSKFRGLISLTLQVNLFFRDPDTCEVTRVEAPAASAPHASEPTLAGPEIWRTQLWSSEWAVQHGAVFLSQLAQNDLYVEHNQLSEFRDECLFFVEHSAELEKAAGQVGSEQTIRSRLANFINAIDQAIEKKCGILIG